MDDDLRNRLRGSGGSGSGRSMPAYLRPERPTPRPAPAAPVEPPKPKPAKVQPRQEFAPKPKKRRRFFKRFFIFVFIMGLFGGAGVGGYWFYKNHKSLFHKSTAQNTSSADQQSTDTKPTGTIRFIASGDNFTFDSINTAAKKADGSYDYSPLYAKVKPFFDKPDIKLCNQSVSASGATGISGYPSFNAPPAFAKGLGDLGCNVINMGTAHMNDKGQGSVNASVAYWDNQPNLLAVAGANRSADEQNKIRYFTIKQVKFAFLSYTTSSQTPPAPAFGVNIYSGDLAQKQVTEARKNAQLVIISMNWGKEDSSDITPEQDQISQVLANLNADIIIGEGPHVVQPAKILTSQDKKHQSLVWYSLGNFLNSQVPVENRIGGIAIMDIDVATQTTQNPSFLPVYMHYEWTADQKKRQSAADLQARHNFLLYPLDQANDSLFSAGQTGTTVQAQTDRVTSILTKFAPIKIIKSADL